MLKTKKLIQTQNVIAGNKTCAHGDGEEKADTSLDLLLDCRCLMSCLHRATAAEYEVASLFVNGLTYSEIADIRLVSIETIRSQVSSLLSKTGSKHRTELIKLVLSTNLSNIKLVDYSTRQNDLPANPVH